MKGGELCFFALDRQKRLIVRAGTCEALAEKIDSILNKYPSFTKKNIVPGVFIIEAADMKQAKLKAGSNNVKPVYFDFDMPLFRVTITE